jgi:hypothetical protein
MADSGLGVIVMLDRSAWAKAAIQAFTTQGTTVKVDLTVGHLLAFKNECTKMSHLEIGHFLINTTSYAPANGQEFAAPKVVYQNMKRMKSEMVPETAWVPPLSKQPFSVTLSQSDQSHARTQQQDINRRKTELESVQAKLEIALTKIKSLEGRVASVTHRRNFYMAERARLNTLVAVLSKESPSARCERNIARKRQRVTAQLKDVQEKGSEARARARTGEATAGRVTKLVEERDELLLKVKQFQANTDHLKAEINDWADAYDSMSTDEARFKLAWTTEEMYSWGKHVTGAPTTLFPPEMVMLCMELCALEAPASQVPSYIKMVLSTFLPGLSNVPVPTVNTVRNWRLGLLPLCDLVSAIQLVTTTKVTICQDGTSKAQRKYGVAVLQTDSGKCMPGGVYTQQGGTAKETSNLVFQAALERPQLVLEGARRYFVKQEDMLEGKQGERQSVRHSNSNVMVKERPDIASFCGDLDANILARVVGSEIPVVTMQDHAPAAKAAAREFDELCEVYAKLHTLSYEGSDEAFCGDHKRANALKSAAVAVQKHLHSLLGEPNFGEWGDILTMLYRQLSNQFCGRGAAYEYGRGVDSYPAYMKQHHALDYRPRISAVGAHYDMNAESALISTFTWERDLEYLLYLKKAKKDGLNKMELKLVHLLGTLQVQMAVKAEVISKLNRIYTHIRTFLHVEPPLQSQDKHTAHTYNV